ncbi:RNA-binding protein [Plasmodium gonderi]|uniref:RNA-binding protein n=1 Tax=Plasmodium gonderi TaxID=77519 RepID=A0A1Y1JFF2_PLAGO|nr:RNA-binding protein [Plasmodium gonderi]GAW79173.1 RNA-binding protein [Plasmodium gonderi]
MEQEESKETHFLNKNPEEGNNNSDNNNESKNENNIPNFEQTQENIFLPNEGEGNDSEREKTNKRNKLTDKGNDTNNEKFKSDIQNEQQNDEWLIYVSNNSYGPYNLDQMKKLWNEKRLNMMSLIFKKGEQNWKYIYNDDILKRCLHFNTPNYDDKTRIVSKNSNSEECVGAYNSNNTSEYCDNVYFITGNTDKGEEKVTNICPDDSNEWKNQTRNDNYIQADKWTYQTDKMTEENPLDIEKMKKREKKKKYLERKKKKMEEGLCDKKMKNSSIYVSGLPNDITKEEIYNVFKKAGIIKIDAETTEPKIKIYYDENNKVKGDALVTYVYVQSVDIAIKYFDNFYIRQDCMIHVEKAQFNKKKEVLKVSKEDILIKKKKIKAAKYEQLRLQKWGDGHTGTKKKIVIFRNVFSYEDAVKYDEGDPFYDFIKDLVEMEVKKYVPVYKVYPIPKHPNGIVCVKFKGVEEAEVIVSCFKDIELNDKKLEVYFYDGKQDLKAQCLPAQSSVKECSENMPENDETNKDTDNNEPSFLLNNNLQSFHDWIDNYSEDEEHEIMVE